MALSDYKLKDLIDGFLYIKSSSIRKTKKGDDYIALVLGDRSGEISANLWDADQNAKNQYVSGAIVKVMGERDEYNGQPQIKITSIRLAETGETAGPADFVAHAPQNESQMRDQVNELLLQIENPTWNKIVRALLKKYNDQFFQFPAAKSNHHNFMGGLAFHSLTIVRLAQAMADIYPSVNRQLLIAGALLHDLGKTIELSGPISTEYTLSGSLIGHITLVNEQIVLAANDLKIDLNDPDLVVLRHVVLSHHGLMEWGSPVVPQMREADLLHELDEIDAHQQMIDSALEHVEPGEFSDKIWPLDSRRFYREK